VKVPTLIDRLTGKGYGGTQSPPNWSLCHEAALRIRELEAALRDEVDEACRMLQAIKRTWRT
jgi:hypothetical protein